MSRQIAIWELNSEQQDNLWIKDKCPFCGAKILDRNLSVDLAYWMCPRCDVTFVQE